MTKASDAELTIRKSFTLPLRLWQAVEDYRFTQRIGSEAEALRRLLEDALRRTAPKGRAK
jgi:hypothetical protein